jgi:hypothetical protein
VGDEMMRKVLTLLLVLLLGLALLLGLGACGGEKVETGVATAEDIALLDSLYNGRQPYHGDMHDHSDSGGRSDGHWPLSMWPSLLEDKDMDFAAIVDHKQVAHMKLPEWDDTIFIGGTEAQTTLKDANLVGSVLHYNLLFTDISALESLLKENKEYGYRNDSDNPGQKTFYYAHFTIERMREIASQVQGKGGFFVHVHPKFKSYLNSNNPLDYWYADYSGIEVITGTGNGHSEYDLRHPENKAAYDLWVELLNLGKIVYATAGSDSHSLSGISTISTIYSAEQKAQNFLQHIRSGDFTAGPAGIRMAIGDATTGGHTNFEGKRLVISVGDFHSKAVKSGNKYRVDIYNENGLVYSQEIDQTQTNYIAIDVDANSKYYRANVYDVTKDYIFAVGNPIWNDK